MLDVAWRQYRGWAARARQMQASSQRWARVAAILACAAAVLGVLASQVADVAVLGPGLALAAAAAAAVAPIVGRDILAVGREGQWIRARATAEMIKSECYRYTARLGDYSGPNAAQLFSNRLNALGENARKAGVTPLPVDEPYKGPPEPMDAAWYLANRLQDQRNWFAKRQKDHEASVRMLRLTSFGFAVLAALLGVAATLLGQERIAPWIAASTTVAASIAAFGLLERRQFLAASFAAMVEQIDRLEAVHKSGTIGFPAVVQAGEDLLAAENRAWTDRMVEMPFVPPTVLSGAAVTQLNESLTPPAGQDA